MRVESRCRHMGYSFRLAARVLLYAPSHRQDNTYHGVCYTSRGALAGSRNRAVGLLWRIDPTTRRTMSERSYHGATSRSTLSDSDLGSKTFDWCMHIYPSIDGIQWQGNKSFIMSCLYLNECGRVFDNQSGRVITVCVHCSRVSVNRPLRGSLSLARTIRYF